METIGKESFRYDSQLTDFDCSSVTSIGSWAFSQTSVSSVIAPNLATIGEHAFYGDAGLISITFGDVTSIETCTFEGCTSLESVNLTNVTSIGDYAFKNCTSLHSVSAPNIVTIGSNAFNRTPVSVVVLGHPLSEYAGAFDSANIITNLTVFGDAVDWFDVLSSCAEYSADGSVYSFNMHFTDEYSGLTSDMIKSLMSCDADGSVITVEKVSDLLFRVTVSNLPSGSYNLIIGNPEFNISITGSLEHCSFTLSGSGLISNNGTYSALAGTELTLNIVNGMGYGISFIIKSGDVVIPTDNSVFVMPVSDVEIMISESDTGIVFVGLDGVDYYTSEGLKFTTNTVYPLSGTVQFGVNITGNLKYDFMVVSTSIISDFSNDLYYVNVGDVGITYVTVVQASAVFTASGSSSTGSEWTISKADPTALTVDGRTYGCIVMPSYVSDHPVNKIYSRDGDGWLFYRSSEIISVVIPSDYTSVSQKIFKDCVSLVYAKVNTTSLSQEMFAGCTALREIILHDGTEVIPTGFLSGCTALTSVEIPDSVTTINNQAFKETGIVSLEIPENVETLGRSVWHNCNSLETVVISSDKLASLPFETFYQCEKLESITGTENIVSIGNRCFGQDAILSFDFSSVEDIGDDAFWGTQITTVLAPNLELLGSDVFSRSDITVFVAPNLTDIGEDVFKGCSIDIAIINSGLKVDDASTIFEQIPDTLLYVFGSQDWFMVTDVFAVYSHDDSTYGFSMILDDSYSSLSAEEIESLIFCTDVDSDIVVDNILGLEFSVIVSDVSDGTNTLSIENAVFNITLDGSIDHGSVSLSGSGVSEISGGYSVIYGSEVTVTVVHDIGYRTYYALITTSGSEVTVNDGIFEMPMSDLVLDISDDIATYNVSTKAIEGTSISADDIAYYGSNFEFTVNLHGNHVDPIVNVTIGGVAYTGYSVSGDVYTIPGEDVTGDIAISSYSHAAGNASYTITYYIGSVEVHQESYKYGEKILPYVYSQDGYEVDTWTGIPTTMPDYDVDVYGVIAGSYTVSLDMGGKVTSSTYDVGEVVRIIAPDGYYFTSAPVVSLISSTFGAVSLSSAIESISSTSDLEVIKVSNEEYTFVMPSDDVNVSANVLEITNVSGYTDMESGSTLYIMVAIVILALFVVLLFVRRNKVVFDDDAVDVKVNGKAVRSGAKINRGDPLDIDVPSGVDYEISNVIVSDKSITFSGKGNVIISLKDNNKA